MPKRYIDKQATSSKKLAKGRRTSISPSKTEMISSNPGGTGAGKSRQDMMNSLATAQSQLQNMNAASLVKINLLTGI